MVNSSDSTRSIAHVVESVKRAHSEGRKVTLLLGAGCSVSAGVPPASGFVELIRTEFPLDYDAVPIKTYPACMDRIGPAYSRKLVRDAIGRAQMNAAHVGVAQLIKHGFVDRVLTPNFDPLVARASALCGVFPATYDLPTSKELCPDDLEIIDDPAVFHLHGQHSGFILLHSEEETREHIRRIRPLIEHKPRERVWIVVGYSGENDPIVDLLHQAAPFYRDLYWVTYNHYPVSESVAALLGSKNRAYSVYGYDADRFFLRLAILLDCFPPDYLVRPFSYLKELMSGFCEFPAWALPTESEEGFKKDLFLLPASLEGERYDPTRLIDEDVQEAVMRFETASELALKHATFKYVGGDPIESLRAMENVDKEDVDHDHYNEALAYAQMGAARVWEHKAKQPSATTRQQCKALRTALRHVQSVREYAGAPKACLLLGASIAKELGLKCKGEQQTNLFKDADDMARQFAGSNRGEIAAWIVWGQILATWAGTKRRGSSEAAHLWSRTSQTLLHAYKLSDGNHSDHWFLTFLLCHAYLNQVGDDDSMANHRLLVEAESMGLESEAKRSGFSSYNLACIYARRSNPERAREWLEKAIGSGLQLKRRNVTRDTDLKSVRAMAWFKELIDQIPE